MKTLFDHAREKILEKEQPLAARMRPRTLDEYIGQSHILAPGRLLHRAIQADQLSSLLFYGPPGTGKTTLAAVIANTTRSHFTVLNAVLAGKADIKAAIDDAQRRLGEDGQRTILFVDEVHRWNKAQQDALLPWVENGTLILVGATTENPYFSVNRALVSRSRIFQLQSLSEDELRQVARAALSDSERGFGRKNVVLSDEALAHLVRVASGDARAVLNALELAVETTPADSAGAIVVDLGVAEESIQQRAVLYDQEGDYHFDIISAFIKSLRGSDPDAAVYWLAKMVYAGEDPRFLFRRMVIFAAEDIGLADPRALTVATAAAEAFDRVGMPEGRYHLGMAALYLATAPKSNSVFAFFDALAAVEKEGDSDVPSHLRDASRDKESFGHGKGYLYPHAYRDHWVAQQYLPKSLQGRVFYQPGGIGHEKELKNQVLQRREAQLAAVLEAESRGDGNAEILTFSPADRAFDVWLERAMGNTAAHLEKIRAAIFDQAGCQRHHTVLVLNADSGLLVWEAVRRVPEGGVWYQVSQPESLNRIRAQAADFPALRTPHGMLAGLPDLWRKTPELPPAVAFDQIIGRNLAAALRDVPGFLAALAGRLAVDGRLTFAETIAAEGDRIHRKLPLDILTPEQRRQVIDAEEAIHASPDSPALSAERSAQTLAAAGLAPDKEKMLAAESPVVVTGALIDRWFGAGPDNPAAGTYSAILLPVLPPEAVAGLAAATRKRLLGATIRWRTATIVASAVKRR